jgi:hypothetical protein
MRFMLKALRDHPLMVGMAELIAAAVRYVGIVLIAILLLGQLAKVAL